MRLRLLAVAAAAAAVAGCGGGSSTARGTVSIDVGKDGCTPSAGSVATGPTTFQVRVHDGNTIPELELVRRPIVLAELENLPGNARRFSFSLDVTPGPLDLYCPGAPQTHTKLTVTGTAPKVADPRDAAAVSHYRTWVESETQQLVNSTFAFVAALHSGNLAQARTLYVEAHAHYERIEPI